jgi:plastocyanin
MASRHRSRRPLAVLSALIIAGLACSSSTDYGSGGGGTITPTADVLIVSGAQGKGAQAFDPNPYTVSLGAGGSVAVKWGNADGIQHRVLADGASPLFASQTLSNAGTYTFTFTTSGTFAYHCSIHPLMVGTIQVNP